jgi:hypothetical protein
LQKQLLYSTELCSNTFAIKSEPLHCACAQSRSTESAIQFKQRVLAMGISDYERVIFEHHLSLFESPIPCREYLKGRCNALLQYLLVCRQMIEQRGTA